MYFTAISAIIILYAALKMLLSAAKGYKKGWLKSIIGLGKVAFCALFASLISVAIASASAEPIMRILYDGGVFDGIITEDALLPVMDIIVRMLLSLVLYIPVFYILRLFLAIIVGIVYKKVTKKDSSAKTPYSTENKTYLEKNDRIIGALIGALCGFIIIVVVFMPLCGIMRSIDNIADITEKISGESLYAPSEDGEELKKYTNDFSVHLIDTCGGKFLFDLTARTNAYGMSASFNEELAKVSEIDLEEYANLLSSIGSAEAADLARIDALLDSIDDSLFMKTLLLSSVNGASDSWLRGESFMGIEKPVFIDYEPVEAFFDEFLMICKTSTPETVIPDIRMLLVMGSAVSEKFSSLSGGNYEGIVNSFTDGSIEKLIDEQIEKNPHMWRMKDAFHNLIFSVLANQIVTGNVISDLSRQFLYNDITDILNDTAALKEVTKNSAVRKQLGDLLSDNSIYASDVLVDGVASMLLENFKADAGALSSDEVEELFIQYALGQYGANTQP